MGTRGRSEGTITDRAADHRRHLAVCALLVGAGGNGQGVATYALGLPLGKLSGDLLALILGNVIEDPLHGLHPVGRGVLMHSHTHLFIYLFIGRGLLEPSPNMIYLNTFLLFEVLRALVSHQLLACVGEGAGNRTVDTHAAGPTAARLHQLPRDAVAHGGAWDAAGVAEDGAIACTLAAETLDGTVADEATVGLEWDVKAVFVEEGAATLLEKRHELKVLFHVEVDRMSVGWRFLIGIFFIGAKIRKAKTGPFLLHSGENRVRPCRACPENQNGVGDGVIVVWIRNKSIYK